MGQKKKKGKSRHGSKKLKPNTELQEYMEDWLQSTDAHTLSRAAAYLRRDLPFEEKVEWIIKSLQCRLRHRRAVVAEAQLNGFVYPPPVPDTGKMEKTKGYLVSRSW